MDYPLPAVYLLPSFNCAAPFRERLARGCGLVICAYLRFNCAAPFRERLVRGPLYNCLVSLMLQLCRPLSGAVSGRA